MKIAISQFYMKPGVTFPFSHLMQRFVTLELTEIANECSELESRHGDITELGITVDADTQIAETEILGPSISRKHKTVVYTLRLPFDVIAISPDGCRTAMEFLVAGVRTVFQKAGIDTTGLDERTASIIDHVCSDPSMLKAPWPVGRRSPATLH